MYKGVLSHISRVYVLYVQGSRCFNAVKLITPISTPVSFCNPIESEGEGYITTILYTISYAVGMVLSFTLLHPARHMPSWVIGLPVSVHLSPGWSVPFWCVTVSTYPVYISGTWQKAAGGMLRRSHVGIAVEIDG